MKLIIEIDLDLTRDDSEVAGILVGLARDVAHADRGIEALSCSAQSWGEVYLSDVWT